MNYLEKEGARQNFPANWYTMIPLMFENGMYQTSIQKIQRIPRLFSDDEIHLKFEKFISDCDNNRVLVAYEDLLQDLKEGKMSVQDDWSAYSNEKNFKIFEDGTIRWAK